MQIPNLDYQQEARMFSQNPIAYLAAKKINLPQQYANDPQGAVQYLMNQGRMTQAGFENLRAMASQMGFKNI